MDNNLKPERSAKFDIILAQLMKAKQNIGAVKKDSTNPFHKSNYASLNAYIDASEHHLMSNGLILVQACNGSYSEPMIVTTLFHPESEQWIKSYLPILNPKQDSQGLGAAVTYMRRYSISTLLGLVSEDDDGETAVGRGKYEQKKAKPEPEVKDDKEADFVQKYLELFEKEDRFLAFEYLEHVMAHFSWTKVQTIKEFLKAPGPVFHEKFDKWKSKHKLEKQP